MPVSFWPEIGKKIKSVDKEGGDRKEQRREGRREGDKLTQDARLHGNLAPSMQTAEQRVERETRDKESRRRGAGKKLLRRRHTKLFTFEFPGLHNSLLFLS